MNTKTFLKLGALLVILIMATTSVFAQTYLAKVYVDVTNGSDTYTGANATNDPFGTGPKATINAGLAAVADGGTLVLVAGNYVSADGTTIAPGKNVDISATSYTQITTGLTIQLTALGGPTGTQEVALANGTFNFDVPGGTLTFTQANGTEFITIPDASFTVGSSTTSGSSTVSIPTNAVKLSNAAPTITLWNGSSLSNKAPVLSSTATATGVSGPGTVNLSYQGVGSFTTGPEAAYSSLVAGSITVNKSSGSITFASPIVIPRKYGTAITITNGDVVFSGAVTLGQAGSSTLSSSTSYRTFGSISVANASNATFNGAVTLYNVAGTGTQSKVINSGTGNVVFNSTVMWKHAYNNNGTNDATNSYGVGNGLVINSGTGAVNFVGQVTFDNSTSTLANTASTSTTYYSTYFVEVRSAGSVSFTLPILNTTGTDGTTQNNTFASRVTHYNASSGTITGSGALIYDLFNSGSAAGKINLNAATTASGIVTNGSGQTISLGGNTLTLAGAATTTTHSTNGGIISATSGGKISITTGIHNFPGGTFCDITTSKAVNFTGGTLALANVTVTSGGVFTPSVAATITGNLSITSGTARIQGAVTVTGNTSVNASGNLLVGDGPFITLGLTEAASGAIAYGGSKVTAVANPGAGNLYTSAPSVSFSLGTGTGAAAYTKLATQSITTVNVTSPGAGYTTLPTVAYVNATNYAGAATSVTKLTPVGVASVTLAGTLTGYSQAVPPTLTFTRKTLSHAVGADPTYVVNVSVAGTLTSVTILTPGSGWDAEPTVAVVGAPGTATATCALQPTTLASIVPTTTTVFDNAPTVTITGGGATTAATAAPIFPPAPVSGVFVTSAGTNFTSAAFNATFGGVSTVTGAVTVAAATSSNIQVNGDFTRTGGTFTAVAGSKLIIGGNVAQNINVGQLLQTADVEFNNVSGLITLSASIRVTGTATIKPATTVALGTFNIIMNGTTGTFDNSGTYTATGGGGVVFGGAGTPYVSNGGTGAYTLTSTSGTGTFSNIIIDAGAGATNIVTVAADAKFTGNLSLLSGGDGSNAPLQVAASKELSPFGSVAKVTRNVVTCPLGIGGAGSFNVAAKVPYDLEYIGTMTAGVNVGSELGSYARTWLVNVDGDQAPGFVHDGTIDYYVTIPSSPTFSGAMSIGRYAGVKVSGTNTFDLTGNSVTHTIMGQLATAAGTDYLIVSGDNVVIVGSDSTAYPAMVGNIKIGSVASRTCTISKVQAFTGTFETLTSSAVTLSMGSSNAATASVLAGERIITGAVKLGGTSFTLGSNVYSAGGVTLGVASSTTTLALGNFNLQVTGVGFTQNTGTKFTATDGFLEMKTGNLVLSGVSTEALSNLRILGATTLLTNDAYVSGKFVIGDAAASTVPAIPTLTLNKDLYFSGSAITLVDDGTGGAAMAGTKTLIITGTGVTMTAGTSPAMGVSGAAYSIANLKFNPTGGTGTLTFATDDTSLTNTRVFTVGNMLTHSAGVLALGVNDLVLTGTGSTLTTAAYVRTVAGGGTITSAGGYLEFSGTATQYFNGGTGWSVPYLRINNSAAVSSVSNLNTTTAFTVTKGLDLKDGIFTTGAASTNLLTMADGSTITRRKAATTGGSLDQAPTFAGKVNLAYVIPDATPLVATDNQLLNLTLSTTVPPIAFEVPSGSTVLNNLTINNSSIDGTGLAVVYGKVTLGKAITVNGTLKLTAGVLDNTSFGVNIAAGGALEMNGGAISPNAPTAASYALVYSAGGTVTSTNTEFPAEDVATITTLTINNKSTSNATIVNLHAARIIGNLVLNSSDGSVGGIDLKSKLLTAKGNVTITKGNFTNTGATSTTFVLGGTAAQTITVPAAGWALPSTVDLRFNNAAGFTLTGGNLYMSFGASRTVAGNTLYFVNGVLSTGSSSVVLAQTTLGQGFDRSGVTGTNVSHINGKVRHSIPGGAGGATYVNGRFEFPVGTSALYRPLAITFSNTYPAINPTNVDVSQVDSSAGGRIGMPLDGGNNVRVGNYPAYFWLIATTPSSFSATQAFDVELQGTNLGYPFGSAADLRAIRRQDGNADVNPWQLQGTATSYQANYINVGAAGDTTVFVRSSSSLGGLVNSGSRFSIGIPTRPPVFTTAPPTGTVNENETLTIQYAADARDVGEVITFGLVSPPTGAAINASTGVLTWKPDYTQAGNVTLTVSATDGQFTITTTTAVTVVNTNRAPVFSPKTVPVTKTDKDTVKVTLAATDADADALTYSFVSINPAATSAPTVSGSTLSWKPVFADAGKVYTILAVVSDGVTTGQGPLPGRDTITVTATINRSRLLGDVDGNGTVQAADASVVLQHVAGLTTITDAAALYAADASKNGTVSAFDAAMILQAAAGLITLQADADVTLGKTEAAAGSLNWSSPEATKETDVVKVNLNIANSANVYAVQLSSKIDANLFSIAGVSASLPEGWEMQWNVVDNELRVAMAGATPMPSGIVTAIMVRMKSRESRLSFSTDAMLNENPQSLGAVEIAAVPTVFALAQNYPNPFNPSTTIKYQIANDANVNLDIYNLQGQKIRTLIAKEQKAGYYSVVWDGRNEAGQTVSSGLYLYRVQAGSFVATHKMLMIK